MQTRMDYANEGGLCKSWTTQMRVDYAKWGWTMQTRIDCKWGWTSKWVDCANKGRLWVVSWVYMSDAEIVFLKGCYTNVQKWMNEIVFCSGSSNSWGEAEQTEPVVIRGELWQWDQRFNKRLNDDGHDVPRHFRHLMWGRVSNQPA